eukprot:585274-Pyramimonas_sp.AAC.1
MRLEASHLSCKTTSNTDHPRLYHNPHLQQSQFAANVCTHAHASNGRGHSSLQLTHQLPAA